ncbi:MAG: Fic family protein [Patescibacteria group bacterium]
MDERFNKRIKITPEILQKISKIDEFKGLWQGGINLAPQILARLKRSVIITSTGSSTRIEGSNMNDEEVERLLAGLKLKKPKGRDAEEVAGYADVLGRIFDNYKTLKLTEGQILQFHEILLHFSEKDKIHKGKYKNKDNVVVAKNKDGQEIILFRPTPPYLVKKEMDDVIFWTNEILRERKLHPLLVIANFVFEFLAIHPFDDGNGRLSRALTNLLLLQNGYSYIPYVSLEEIIEEKQNEYYMSLRQTQKLHKTENEDILAWVIFLLDALIEQTNRAKNLLNKNQPENIMSPKQLEVWNLFKNIEVLGVKEISEKLENETPLVTIKQALSRLVSLKLIERIGLGRSTRYRKTFTH